jgi:hypothetical protein
VIRVVVASLILSMIAASAAEAARPHRQRPPAEVHDSWRARHHHAGKGERGVSSYGGDIYVGSSYKPPKRRHKGL